MGRRAFSKAPDVAPGTFSANDVYRIYYGSNGEETQALYLQLKQLGAVGELAVNLFRACKTSERAKLYAKGGRVGRGYSRNSYDRKDYSIKNLGDALTAHAAAAGIKSWGWARDEEAKNFEDVLYVDLPTGQVSFHNIHRHAGPDYRLPWDGVKGKGAERIIAWVKALL